MNRVALPLARRWSLMLASLLTAVMLSGCLPIPIYEVSPSTPRAGTELTFDASGTIVSNIPEDTVAVGWEWDFGDGSSATGETVTHTYETAGTYTVKLTVTDSAGREASVEDPLVVKEALATSTDTTTDTSTDESTDTSSETETDSETDTETTE